MDDLVNTLDRVAEGRHRSGAGRGGATTTTASGGTLEDPVRIEPLGMGDVASAVELVTRVLRVKPGDRGEQFAFDIDDDARQMFVAKANDQVIAYGRVAGLAAGEAAPGSPPGYYLTGVLVEPAWRGRGIATALTRARLDWVFARTDR
ncbi:MAG: GNAT family N-acetyltransferase, partial [Acidimicrobiales bacterium]|nr:GNAT family N-acetyltransferase [Acidimicrobiales bacterium]